MSVRSVQIRGFRSIASSGLEECGGLNVLIGKNNAGKSNVLSAIELMLLHLKGGRISGNWPTNRPKREFTDSNEATPLRVGVEFDLSADISEGLRIRLTKEAPHLERSIEQLKSHSTVVFIVAGATDGSDAYLFIEQMAVGRLTSKGEDIATEGIRLLSVTKPVAQELYRNLVSARALRSDVQVLEEFLSASRPPLDFIIQQPKERRVTVLQPYGYASRMRPETFRQFSQRLASATSTDEIETAMGQLVAETREKAEVAEKRETEGALSAFAGDSKSVPAYAEWLIEQFGNIAYLHIKERKQEIGREEAQTLLRLKIRRGPDRLGTIQQTVKTLLGVKVDAFEAENATPGRGLAELDVDDFLVEANGAGIREALRIILDLELKAPQIVLIEEPEVHLHPGLSRVIAGYLREKSQSIQMFVTTHSTEFVDSVSFQHVFLVFRDLKRRTVCQTVEAEEGALRIPAELGLKLSTVFMFDKLIFVEGPSDEGILREMAKKLQLDLTRANVGFVYMKGVRNFAHFAAESTLSLLSRRKIQMWFLADRDENSDADVARMMERLDGRARLKVFHRRELENYLLDDHAISTFVEDKQRASGVSGPRPDPETVNRYLHEEAASLKGEVVRLRLEKRLLSPIFLHTRTNVGTIEERMRRAIDSLNERLGRIGNERTEIAADLDQHWGDRALTDVPGTILLEQLARKYGVAFSKDKGDGELLARLLPAESIAPEIRELLEEVTHEPEAIVAAATAG